MASDLESASSPASSQMDGDVMEFWRDPKNYELIVNAVSLESLEKSVTMRQVIRDQFVDIKDEIVDEILSQYFPERHPCKETEVSKTVTYKKSFKVFGKPTCGSMLDASKLERFLLKSKAIEPEASESMVGIAGTETFQPLVAQEQMKEKEFAEISKQERVQSVGQESGHVVGSVEESVGPDGGIPEKHSLVLTEFLKTSSCTSKENLVVGSYAEVHYCVVGTAFSSDSVSGTDQYYSKRESVSQSEGEDQKETLSTSTTIVSTDYFYNNESVKKVTQAAFCSGVNEFKNNLLEPYNLKITCNPVEEGGEEDNKAGREGGDGGGEEGDAGREEGDAGRKGCDGGGEEGDTRRKGDDAGREGDDGGGEEGDARRKGGDGGGEEGDAGREGDDGGREGDDGGGEGGDAGREGDDGGGEGGDAGRKRGDGGGEEGDAGRKGDDEGEEGEEGGDAGRKGDEAGREEGVERRNNPGLLNGVNLDKIPYNSVGKLFWLGKNNNIRYNVTAFYAGNRTIVTVAHAFDSPRNSFMRMLLSKFNLHSHNDPREAIFVPAMEDRHDIYGRRYGFYKIGDVLPLPEHNPRGRGENFSSCQDVCRAIISEGWRKNGNDEFESVNVDVLPILRISSYEEKNKNQWSIIGYGELEENKDLQMLEYIGLQTSENIETVSNDDHVEVEITDSSATLIGMSGGPWIREGEDEATGVQSGEWKVKINDKQGKKPKGMRFKSKAKNTKILKVLTYSPFLTQDKLQTLSVGKGI